MGVIYIDDNWTWNSSFDKEMLGADYDVKNDESVRIPHSVTTTSFNYFDEHEYQMISGYRRVLHAKEEWQDKVVLLTFEGVAHEATVYVNSTEVMTHRCGYTAFTIDISDYLRFGEDNIIVVRVDSNENLNVPPFGFVIDYMTYGGIYRDVYLEIKNQTYIEDVYARPIVEFMPHGYLTRVESDIQIVQKGLELLDESVRIRQKLVDNESKEEIFLGESAWHHGKQVAFSAGSAELWDINNPCLYKLVTELVIDEETIDEKVVPIGFRKSEFRKDGYYLNNKRIKIRGLNRHQSYPYVGYAMPKSMQQMDADVLKDELGVNAVRTSHYPQSRYFIDRCDEIGLLVFTEMPGWQHIGDAAWQDEALHNLEEMIIQYRNHPSVILWGVRINESIDNDEFYLRTNELAHKLDPTRQTGGVRALEKMSLLEDVYTYNDFSHWKHDMPGCRPKKEITPDMNKPYLISEYNGHMFPTKSYDSEEHRREHALRHADVLDSVMEHSDICGSFGWCMADYNTHKDFGSGDRICYHGVLDMFRNPKMAAYVYAMQQDERDVLELTSSMDIGEHPGCNRGETYILTNAESVRMYKNGRFIKEYYPGDSEYRHIKSGPIAIDDYLGDVLTTEAGLPDKTARLLKVCLNDCAKNGMGALSFEAKVAAAKAIVLHHMKFSDASDLYTKYVGDWGGESTQYRFEAMKNDKVVKVLIKESVRGIHLEALADHYELKDEYTYDVAAVRIRALDRNDNLVSFFQDAVKIETEGDIEVIGPEIISLKGGMFGTYVKTTGKSGTIKIETDEQKDVRVIRIVFTPDE